MGSLYDKASTLSGTGAAPGGTLYSRASALADGKTPVVETPEPEAFEDTQTKVLERIREKRARGEDTTRLEAALRRTVAPAPDVEPESFIETAKKAPKAVAETFFPAISQYLKTTGGVLGEGAAAILPGGEAIKEQLTGIDEEKRSDLQNQMLEQIREGKREGRDVSRLENALRESLGDVENPLRALETIDETTPTEYVKYAVAAGIEYSVYRSFPSVARFKLGKRIGAGAIQGVGFAIAEGMAHDRSPEEIMASLPAYGVGGSVITAIAPYLLPLLKAELKSVPSQLKELFKGIQQEIRPRPPVRLDVVTQAGEGVRVPISTPNTRYEAYLRSQGYEPYIPEKELPTIEFGRPAPRVRDDLPVIDADPDIPKQRRVREVPTRVEEPAPTIRDGEIVPEERVTTVPREQVPVGEGEVAVSRLEARVKGILDDPKAAQRAEEEGLETYQIMNKQDQIRKAAEYVQKNPEEALAVLRGEKSAPKGLLNNSIALALEKHADDVADANLAIKLASLRSTRAGQEISILTEADPTNPVSFIDEIIKARAQRVQRRLKTGETVQRKVQSEVKAAKAEMNKEQIKIGEANKLLDELVC